METGDEVRAIEYYRKSPALNPENGNAVPMLEKMGAKP